MIVGVIGFDIAQNKQMTHPITVAPKKRLMIKIKNLSDRFFLKARMVGRKNKAMRAKISPIPKIITRKPAICDIVLKVKNITLEIIFF